MRNKGKLISKIEALKTSQYGGRQTPGFEPRFFSGSALHEELTTDFSARPC